MTSSATSTRPALKIAGLRKSFDDKVVLDGIDLEIAEGTVFALLGPNGAGKTTIVRILSTLVPADSGDVQVAGHDVVDDPDGVRASIGVTGQFSAVDELLTGNENLQLMADLNHSAASRGGLASTIYSTDLASWTRPRGRCRRTRAGCAAASTCP